MVFRQRIQEANLEDRFIVLVQLVVSDGLCEGEQSLITTSVSLHLEVIKTTPEEVDVSVTGTHHCKWKFLFPVNAS